MKAALAGIVLGGSLLAALAAAGSGGGDPLTISPLTLHSGNRSFDDVEQQGAIPNDTGCPWDPDDDIMGSGGGELDPGQSASVSACVIVEKNLPVHALVLTVNGKKGRSGAQEFASEIAIQYRGRLTTDVYRVTDSTPMPYTNPAKPQAGTVMRERLCVVTTYPDGTEEIGPVGSYGGLGVYTVVTYTVTNLGSRREEFYAKAEVSASLANEPVWAQTMCDGATSEPWFRWFRFGSPNDGGPVIWWNVGDLTGLN